MEIGILKNSIARWRVWLRDRGSLMEILMKSKMRIKAILKEVANKMKENSKNKRSFHSSLLFGISKILIEMIVRETKLGG